MKRTMPVLRMKSLRVKGGPKRFMERETADVI